MTLVESIMIAVALAMDCFTVSITCGLIQKRLVWKTMLLTAFMFGLFQGVMPLLGWAGIGFFHGGFERIDHWVAFSLLLFLGGRMIWSGSCRRGSEEACFDPSKFSVTLTMAVATSIDAFAVGLSFMCMGMTTWESVCSPIVVIAVVSVLFSIIGFITGAAAGKRIHFPVESVGGAILIFIGIKILVEHLAG